LGGGGGSAKRRWRTRREREGNYMGSLEDLPRVDTKGEHVLHPSFELGSEKEVALHVAGSQSVTHAKTHGAARGSSEKSKKKEEGRGAWFNHGKSAAKAGVRRRKNCKKNRAGGRKPDVGDARKLCTGGGWLRKKSPVDGKKGMSLD